MKTTQLPEIPTSSTSSYPEEMPARFQQILQVLDDHREGRAGYQAVQAIDEQELRQARAWMRDWMNTRMEDAFPEINQFDEF